VRWRKRRRWIRRNRSIQNVLLRTWMLQIADSWELSLIIYFVLLTLNFIPQYTSFLTHLLGQVKGSVHLTVCCSLRNQCEETSVQGRLEVLQFTVNNLLAVELLLSQMKLRVTDSLRL
jgi:hypothetical protein